MAKVTWHVTQFVQNGDLAEQIQDWLRDLEGSTPGVVSVQIDKCHDGWTHENKVLVIAATKLEVEP